MPVGTWAPDELCPSRQSKMIYHLPRIEPCRPPVCIMMSCLTAVYRMIHHIGCLQYRSLRGGKGSKEHVTKPGYQELSESKDLIQDFSLWGWIKSEDRKIKVDTLDALVARILGAAADIQKRDDQNRKSNSRSSYTSCKMRWRLRWYLWIFVTCKHKNCHLSVNKSVT